MKPIRGYSVSVIILQTLFWSKLLFLTWKIHVMIDHLDWLFCAKFPIDADLNLSLYNYVYVCLFFHSWWLAKHTSNCFLLVNYQTVCCKNCTNRISPEKEGIPSPCARSFQSAKKVFGRLENMCTSFIASKRHIFNLQGKPTLPQVDLNTF